MKRRKIVTEYARMWPREVFDVFHGSSLVIGTLEDLMHPGVYVLYRDDTPYYIGKTRRTLFRRLHDHANKSTDRYFNFWNYFSVFVVPDSNYVDEVEGILIASIPTANSAVPKIRQIRLPGRIAKVLRDARRRAMALPLPP